MSGRNGPGYGTPKGKLRRRFAALDPALKSNRGARRGTCFQKAFEPQCKAVAIHCTDAAQHRRRGLTLFALALGSFCIGASEFASMGVLQLFADSLDISIPVATNAITAYAFGVVIGAPLVTLAAARLNRKSLLLALLGLFIVGNVLSALAANLGMFAIARFISGMPQGAYFGAGALVASYIVGPGHGGKAFALVMTGLTVATIIGSPLATFLGQNLGWRNTYFAVAGVGVLALMALWAWVPRTDALNGGAIVQELSSLRRGAVWIMMLVAALGVASIFAVYTFIGPFVTNVAFIDPAWIPLALALFGIGMTTGNLIGGRLADEVSVARPHRRFRQRLDRAGSPCFAGRQCRISDDWSLRCRHDDDDRHSDDSGAADKLCAGGADTDGRYEPCGAQRRQRLRRLGRRSGDCRRFRSALGGMGRVPSSRFLAWSCLPSRCRAPSIRCGVRTTQSLRDKWRSNRGKSPSFRVHRDRGSSSLKRDLDCADMPVFGRGCCMNGWHLVTIEAGAMLLFFESQ